MKNKKKNKIKNIAILIENIEYGGTTTHLINLINSNRCKFIKFYIITNKDKLPFLNDTCITLSNHYIMTLLILSESPPPVIFAQPFIKFF